MPRPFTLLDRVDTPEGPLELRQRGERDFMISIKGRVLMTSNLHRSELAVAELACGLIGKRPHARVLIGGLGLGYTLRAALDALPKTAQVVVAELNPVVERWCRGPLAQLTNDALNDPRVQVVIGDVTAQIRRAANSAQPFDAIILDLYVGPGDVARGQQDPLYGAEIVRVTHGALTAGGVYTVWAEEPNQRFLDRLSRAGFKAELLRVDGGGPRHSVYRGVKGR